MSVPEFWDLSDNNAVQHDFTGRAGVILKLYPPSNARGWAWLKAQHLAALAWQRSHGSFVIGFYAADSTPTWTGAKAAADALGPDLNEHPFMFDLREFGFSQSYVKNQVTAAHKAGQVKVGHYWRLTEEVGQDWRMKADYSGVPDDPWFMHQHTSTPLDLSHPHAGITVADIVATTTKGTTPPPPPPNGGDDDMVPQDIIDHWQAYFDGLLAGFRGDARPPHDEPANPKDFPIAWAGFAAGKAGRAASDAAPTK